MGLFGGEYQDPLAPGPCFEKDMRQLGLGFLDALFIGLLTALKAERTRLSIALSSSEALL